MRNDAPAGLGSRVPRAPLFTYAPFLIGLRYLLTKSLSYLAILGVALSVGVLIVVMSVFTGFHIRLTQAIRGYLSDLQIRPYTAQIYGLEDWEVWREQALAAAHVEGAAPFIQGFGLVALPGSKHMEHVLIRGIDARYEPTVSELPSYMQVGQLSDLHKTYTNPEGERLPACFVGKLFPGFTPEWRMFNPDRLDVDPGQLVLITATPDLRRSLAKYAVNGLFETTYLDYDSKYVIMAVESATDLLGSGGAVSGLNVRLDDYENAEAARNALRERLAPGAKLRTFGQPSAGIQRASFSGDGSRLAALTDDGTVIVWDVGTGREVASGGGVTGQPTADSATRPHKATAVALGSDGEVLAVGYEDGTAPVLNLESNAQVFSTSAADEAVTAASFSADEFFLALGYRGGSVTVWEAETGDQTAALRGHDGAVNEVTFDAAGERVLSAGDDGTARIWDPESGELLVTLADSARSAVAAAAFSPDGKTVATGHADGRFCLWDSRSGRQLGAWPAQAGPIRAVRFGERSDLVMTAAEDAIVFWQIEGSGETATARRYFTRRDETGTVVDAAFSPNGKRVACVGQDGLARLYYSGSGFYITTWEEQQKTFLEAVAMERFLQALILSLMLVLAGFFIFAIVTTMVYERRRDIGIMKAIGFRQGQICQVFVIAGLAIGVAGALLGVVGGVVFADNINAVREFVKVVVKFDPFPPEIYYFKDIPAHVGFLTPILTAGGAILCSLLFSIVPALRAARMDPIEALHYE